MFVGPDQKMKMIRHQCPGIDYNITPPTEVGHSPDEILPIRLISEYLGTLNSPPHNMVQGPWCIKSRLSWHNLLFKPHINPCQVNSAPTSPFLQISGGCKPSAGFTCWLVS